MLCPTLVGRDDEMKVLRGALDAALAGEGGVVLLAGEAGVGKSRMLRELRRAAADQRTPVLSGRAVDRGAPAPFRPVAEALQGARRITELPDAPQLAPFRPLLATLVPELESDEPRRDGKGEALRPSDAPLALAEAVTRLLAVLAEGAGCLLLLEDLHWADAETLTVVEYLADHLVDERVLCVGTVRTGEPGDAHGLARRLGERRSATLLELGHLGDEGVDEMLTACLGTEDVAPELATFLRARAEGIPLLVEELLAGLVNAGAVVRRGSGWEVRSRLTASVPLTFADTVQRRLELLGDDGRRVVAAAAVLGRHFDWSLLPRMTDLDDRTVLAALRRATELQLLAIDPESGAFLFRHALSRDVALADLLPPERAAVAGRGVDVLEARHPDLPGEWLELAGELAAVAGDDERAARHLLDVGRRALGAGAVRTAEANLRRAATMTSDEGGLRLDIDEAMAQAAALAGRVEEAVELGFRVLDALVAEPAAALRRARLRLVLARAALTAGDHVAAADHAREAGALAAAEDEAVAAHADALGAQAALALGDVDAAVGAATAAVERGERCGAPAATCEALEVLGREARGRDLEAAESHFAAALRVADRHDLGLWRARALHELGTIDLFTTMRTDRFEEARRAAELAGAVPIVALVDLHLCAVHGAQWQPAAAIEAGERCVELSGRLGLATYGMGLVHLAIAHAELADEVAMRQVVDRARAVAGDEVDVAAGIPGRVELTLAVRRADIAGARAALDDAVAELRHHPATTFPFWGVWALLHAIDGVDLAELHDEAAAAPGSANVFTRIYLRLAAAVDAGRRGDGAAAAEHMAAAEAGMREYVGMEVWRAVGLWLTAHSAVADRWGDPAGWLRRALAAFDERGLVELASSCRALLRDAGEAVPRRGRGDAVVPDSLRALGVTSREVDVLRLLADRLSNREIAARLHLSPRTVERHVGSLLAKTGERDRAALALLASGSDGPRPRPSPP